jgi:hypothetical protein
VEKHKRRVGSYQMTRSHIYNQTTRAQLKEGHESISAPHTKEQNGRVERVIGVLKDGPELTG